MAGKKRMKKYPEEANAIASIMLHQLSERAQCALFMILGLGMFRFFVFFL